MPALPNDVRLILAHKQKTSGRLRFLRFDHGPVAFTPLPPLSDLLEDTQETRVIHHPAMLIQAAEDMLKLPAGSLSLEPEFQATVDTPGGRLECHLASFTTIDPPFEQAETLGGKFVAITEMVGGKPVEMELLRQAYTVLLG